MMNTACLPAGEPDTAEPEWRPAGHDLRDVARQLRPMLAAGIPVAITTVLGAHGTVLRQPGTVLAVSESGQTIGFNPAGPLDGAIRDLAAAALATGYDQLERLEIDPDAASYAGLSGGASLDVHARRLHPGDPMLADLLREAGQDDLGGDATGEPAPGWPCRVDELRTLFLFEKLSEDQLALLCREGQVEQVEPGPVFGEGEAAERFYVLLDGEVVLSRRVGADDVEISRTARPGVYGGAMQVYLGDRVPQVYTASLRATRPSRFYVLSAAAFHRAMQDWFPMMLHLMEGMFTVSQRERLLALGSLSAELTHELNNPAAAALRAIPSLRQRVAGLRHKLTTIAAGPADRDALHTLIRLQEHAAERASQAPALSPLEASDREDEVGDWLQAHGVAGGWQLAPTLVQAGLDTGWLDQVAAAVPQETLDDALAWLGYTAETELLLDEAEDSTRRIYTLVDAARQYAQLDQAPHQVLDVHQLLDSTLLMMSARLGDGIAVVKDYDQSLPQIPVYAAELNQVWTNLIDNAVSAMGGTGTLTVRTAWDQDRVLVEIGDTGPGVPADIRERIFEPFFTTKPAGQNAGLGLDISWRTVVKKHHGDLQVASEPGNTRFRVRLPLTTPGAAPRQPA